jgi:putative ABC transport system permease protein
VGAGLLSTSLSKLGQVHPGFDADDLLIMPIRFPVAYEQNEARSVFMSDLIRRIDAVPGVESVSWTPDPPLYWRYWVIYIRTEETRDLANERLPKLGTHLVGPDFFETIGIPILQGRGITWADDAGSTQVAVVDEMAAERLWPNQNPIGKELAIQNEWRTVVGVVGRVHQSALSEAEEPEVYIPAFQGPFYFPTTAVTIRSRIPVADAAAALRTAVWDVDPTVLIPAISAAEDRIAEHLRTPRFIALLGSAFSLSALALTLAAVFGMMSYWVSARTREVSLRMALGAQDRQVLWVVLRQCLPLVLVGLGAGLALAAASSRLLNAFLFGISSLDLQTYVLVGACLCVSALLASLAPAIRATRVEPIVVLKGE